jgi:hypothetical protein
MKLTNSEINEKTQGQNSRIISLNNESTIIARSHNINREAELITGTDLYLQNILHNRPRKKSSLSIPGQL